MAKSKVRASKPPKSYDDNPEWTNEDFLRAKPAAEIDPQLASALKRGRGRPAVEKPKMAISLRLDPEVIDGFKETGKGWQGRINLTLAAVARDLNKPIVRKAAANKRLSSRHGDYAGGVLALRSDTLVGTLRQTYGESFLAGYRGDTKLGNIMRKEGVSTLSELIRKKTEQK
jgi:uncharacterized protein (DUF4415 family)